MHLFAFTHKGGITVNKNDLVASIAHAAQISKNAAERGFNGLLSTLLSAMKEGK